MTSTETITFTSAPMTHHGGNPSVVCDRCGAFIIDWAKSNREFTSDRPNRDRHAAWHAETERRVYVLHVEYEATPGRETFVYATRDAAFAHADELEAQGAEWVEVVEDAVRG
jgi:hypothetical protein